MKLKKSVKKMFVILVVVLLLVVLAYGGYRVYSKISSASNKTKVEVVNEIKEYGYSLEKDAPKLYKNLFEQLQKTLSKEEINEDEYAKLVAQMLVLDFYNIDNKISKNDIGGVQFILKDYQENFILEASNTVYKYVEHNVYGDRKQELPVVKNVSVKEFRTGSYQYGDITDSKAYVVTVNVEYQKDLGYPTEVVVKMLHKDNKLQVFYMK